jgi:exonuclease III
MRNSLIRNCLHAFLCLCISEAIFAQNSPVLKFDFDKNVKSENQRFIGKGYAFTNGIEGEALAFNPDKGYNNISLDNVSLDGTKDFSIQCWIKTSSEDPMVFLSKKDFTSKGISVQKNAGWALYSYGGTFACSIGSGDRRINYERDNGELMPINDGKWHQMTITYNKELSEFRLYYDGHNKAIYKVGFDFSNHQALVIGSVKNNFDYENDYLVEIIEGKKQLQAFVDEFNKLGLEPLRNEEFIDFISSTEKIFEQKIQKLEGANKKYSKEDLSKTLAIREKLLPNPYTVYQIRDLTVLKPISKIYVLKEGNVVINDSAAKFFTDNEKLYPSDFAMDELSIWDSVINQDEVMKSYQKYKKGTSIKLTENLKDLTVGVWNIWNGGIHWSLEEDGWDSRLRIVDMIKKNNADIILMQETYSAGDFISAELGYYFATTSDLDYRYQGANISVISRYPIKEIQVSEETGYNNVAVKLAISKTQEIWAMSNWYGMGQFPAVFDFHKSRFENADQIPVLFGGDFNAVPHTDKGRSPASKKMLEEGFTDAYRSLYPDVDMYPGFSHRRGSRIDQLYYKGKGLKNNFTEVISSWPTGFPSDHFLIVSKFTLIF